MASTSRVQRVFPPERKRGKFTTEYGDLREFGIEDDWELYSDQLEVYFAEKSIPGDKQVAVLLAVVSPLVYEVLRESCHPDLPQLQTYARLSQVLKIHYSQKSSIFEERIKFHEAKQADNESVNDWLARVMSLAVFCEFEKQLDHILKDKFMSGLADQRIVGRLREFNGKAMQTMRRMVDVAVQMDETEKSSLLKQQKQPGRSTSSNVTNVLDLPNEILVKISLHLNARERASLGNSCQRFNNLVFQDEKLLRDLDFSQNGHLTSVSDIQQYFNNKDTRKHILRVNVSNVICLRPQMLIDTIGKATNLLDVHMHGIAFQDIWQIASLFNQLPHVQRLSIDWLYVKSDCPLFRQRLVDKPWSRLTYLSIHVKIDIMGNFLDSLQQFEALEELHIELDPPKVYEPEPETVSYLGEQELRVLPNLKIVQYCGIWAGDVKARLVTMLPDPKKWTDIAMDSFCHSYRFYLEKDMEVCKQLAENKLIKGVSDVALQNSRFGRILVPERLLDAVLRITHENVPEQLCCLSTFVMLKRCLLSIEDMKRLLQDPKHQISFLYLNHDIDAGCHVHLIASAFPNITELKLSNLIKKTESIRNMPHFTKHLQKRGSAVPEERDGSLNLDSSFKLLIDHTPRVKHLTLQAESTKTSNCHWDLDALYLIPRWNNLETLHLSNIPIVDGEFLIEIGKQCRHLQELSLFNLGHRLDWCYEDELSQMLPHCHVLREFSIKQRNIGQVSELIARLSNNLQLRRVRVKTQAIGGTTVDFVSSIKQLLRRCSELTVFICEIDYASSAYHKELSSAVRRLGDEFRHLNLRIEVLSFEDDPHTLKIGTIHKETCKAPSCPTYFHFR